MIFEVDIGPKGTPTVLGKESLLHIAFWCNVRCCAQTALWVGQLLTLKGCWDLASLNLSALHNSTFIFGFVFGAPRIMQYSCFKLLGFYGPRAQGKAGKADLELALKENLNWTTERRGRFSCNECRSVETPKLWGRFLWPLWTPRMEGWKPNVIRFVFDGRCTN